MEQTPKSVQEQPRFVEEKERFGAKVREVFKSEPNSLQDEIEDIEYETGDGKITSIKSLLPREWKMVRSSFLGMDRPMVASFAEKTVAYGENYWIPKAFIVPKGEPLPEPVRREDFIREVFPGPRGVLELSSAPQIERNGFFISLLHEIGHSQVFENMSEEEQAKFLEHVSDLSNKRKSQYAEQDKKTEIENERKSWAWALKEFRQLKRGGVDLEPELDSPDKLLRGIHAALDTREDMNPVEFIKLVREALFQE